MTITATGSNSSGRHECRSTPGGVPGWDLPDHDLAVIDANAFSLNYACSLMNICMGVAVNPATGRVFVIGTDANNSVRFQSVLDGTFIRVEIAQVDPVALTSAVQDLNPHLDYSSPTTSQTNRDKSLGDPRGIVWSADGSTGYVTGMGSDNLTVIDANGNRAGLTPTINVGQGPTGMALDQVRGRLYVYNRFDGSLLNGGHRQPDGDQHAAVVRPDAAHHQGWPSADEQHAGFPPVLARHPAAPAMSTPGSTGSRGIWAT